MIPSHAKKVQPHDEGSVPVFQQFNVEGQMDAMHEPEVQLKSGGYIDIDPTEALVSIDVNSGRATKERNIEETALKTNIEAAEEIARQLRLRDLAGLIVIDFIDMEVNRNQTKVERALKDAMRIDRARIQIGRISPFGLLELSRQRLRPSLHETSFEPCAHCGGTGVRRSTESTALQMLRILGEEGQKGRSKQLTLYTPTAVALYLFNNKRSAIADIEQRFDLTVRIEADDNLIPPDHRLDRVKADGAVETAVESRTESDEEKSDEEGGGRKRRRRRRGRKRGGDNEQQDAQETRTADASDDQSGDEAAADTETREGSGEQSDEEKPKRRRRGRRGGRRRRRSEENRNEDNQNQSADGDQQAAASDGEQPDNAENAGPDDDSAEAAPTEAAADSATDAAQAADDTATPEPEEKPKRTRSRRTRKKADDAGESGDGEDKPAKPRRRRSKKAEAEDKTEADGADAPAADAAAAEPAADPQPEPQPAPQPEPEATPEPAAAQAEAPADEGEPAADSAKTVVIDVGGASDGGNTRRGWWNRLTE